MNRRPLFLLLFLVLFIRAEAADPLRVFIRGG